MIKKLLVFLCLCSPAWATTTITGNLKTLGGGTISLGTFVRFYLRGCSGNQPRINGTALIGPTLGNVFYADFVPNSSGAISGTVYSTTDATGTGNGDIECGGVKTGLWYGMVAFLNGKAGPEMPIPAKNASTIDISNITPLTATPVIVSPTGDTTYARLDGGNMPFTGTVQAPVATISQIDHQRIIDGTTYANTGAGFQLAVSDCVADSLCSDVHAELLGSVSTTTVTSLTKPMRVWLGAGTVISGTSDPVICFSNSVQIEGVTGNITATTVSAIISTAAASRVLAPCSTNPHILYPVFRGVALINTSASRTAKILDLTNTNHARFQDVGMSSSGGSADMVFVTIVAPVVDAFWNNFDGVKLQGTGTEVGYHFDGGANSQVVKGGFVNNVANCYSVTQGGAAVTDDIEFVGTTCEANTGAALVTTGTVQSVHGIGNRMEANTPATLFNTSAGSSHIEMNGTAEFGTQNCGTANGVSFIGWPLGSPCTPSASGAGNTAEIYTVRDISANFITGRAATASNTNSFTGTTLNDAATFSADALGSGFGLLIQDSNASGHNFRLGDINCAGCFNIRDITQTGQPFWGFRATSTAASVEGRFAHAITASRTWTMPDVTGTVGVNLNATNGIYQTKRGVAGCTTGAAAGNSCGTDITVTWGTAFADANYSVACTGSTPTNVPSAPFVVSATKLAATVHINYFAITAAAASYATIDCIAVHD